MNSDLSRLFEKTGEFATKSVRAEVFNNVVDSIVEYLQSEDFRARVLGDHLSKVSVQALLKILEEPPFVCLCCGRSDFKTRRGYRRHINICQKIVKPENAIEIPERKHRIPAAARHKNFQRFALMREYKQLKPIESKKINFNRLTLPKLEQLVIDARAERQEAMACGGED